ncbi:MAG: glycosyltransferase [Halioglobus sp.]
MKDEVGLGVLENYSVVAIVPVFNGLNALGATVESINRQSGSFTLEIVLVLSPDFDNKQGLREWMDINPWHTNVTCLESPLGVAIDAALSVSTASHFVQLCPGEKLLPGSISALLSLQMEQQLTVSYGARRWHDNTLSWTHPAVDSFFQLPKVIQPGLATKINVLEVVALGLYERSVIDNRDHQATSVAILKEYVCYSSFGHPLHTRQNKYRIPVYDQAPKILPALFPASRGINAEIERPRVWIFGERAGRAAEDNGWALFRYCADNCADIESFYVVDDCFEGDHLADYKDRILVKGTEAWQESLSRATHFLFTDSAADVLLSHDEVRNYPSVVCVYLTHGYLGHYPGIYQRNHQYIDYVACCSSHDANFARTLWNFDRSAFLEVGGLPRWDSLALESKDRLEILLCPTWRKSINSEFWHDKGIPSDEDIEAFKQTGFYRHYSSLLASPALIQLLDSNDAHLLVNIHFRLKPYISLFDSFSSDRIKVLSEENDGRSIKELIAQCSLLITDYSSIAWDMAYLNKPVVCYQFDKAAVMAERRLLRYGMMDGELFSDMVFTEDELISSLELQFSRDLKITNGASRNLHRYLPELKSGGFCSNAVQEIRRVSSGLHAEPEVKTKDIHTVPTLTSLNLLATLGGVANRDFGRVGFIADCEIANGSSHIRIRPEDWKESIETGTFDLLIVQPHLNSRSPWASIFFRPEKTIAFLREICDGCQKNNVAIHVIPPEFPMYRGALDQFYSHDQLPFTASKASNDNNEYTVSVVIPAFNSENYIGRCIDSVLDQDFSGTIEVIVVDDGSVDSTLNVVRSYQQSGANVVCISQKNSMQGVARNRGLLAATGKYITFLDSDDVLPKIAVTTLFTAIKRHNTQMSVGLVASCEESGTNQRINQSFFHYSKAPELITPNTWPHVFYDPSCVGKLYSRSFLLKQEVFSPQSFQEDQAFNFSLFSRVKEIAVCDETVYLYIARPDDQAPSDTQTFTNEKLRQISLTGGLASHYVEESSISETIKSYAIGFLVLRYDRFLWAQYRDNVNYCVHDDRLNALSELGCFLSSVSDDVILTNTRYHPITMLLLKYGAFSLAESSFLSIDDSHVDCLKKNSTINDKDLELLADGGSLASSYNYYRSVPIKSSLDNVELVNEESYGYRLGFIFVDCMKNPSHIVYMPFRSMSLLADMVTKNGRLKQKNAYEEISRHKNSQWLYENSEYIKLTAAYRLGVALLEAFTHGPKSFFSLPAKVSQIYRETKP